jgi:hypothetical protein
MGHDQRHSIVMTRADVDELYVETIDLGDKHWQGIQFRFSLSPVIFRAPIADESLELRQLHALGLIGDVSLAGHRVAKMRRRRSSRSAWGTLTRKGRIASPAGAARSAAGIRPTTPAVAAAPRSLRRLVQNDSVDIGLIPGMRKSADVRAVTSAGTYIANPMKVQSCALGISNVPSWQNRIRHLHHGSHQYRGQDRSLSVKAST